MYALTIVATLPEHPVTTATLARLQAYGEDAGLVMAGSPQWLEPHMAADLYFTHCPRPDHIAAIRAALAAAKMDVFITDMATRQKKLFMADMDATMVTGETMNDLAERAGLGPKIAELTALSMRGDMTFAESFTTRVGMLKGVSEKLLFDVRDAMRLSEGARTLVQTLKAKGVTCVLVSGGLDVFTAHAAELCGFDAHHGNRIGIENGILTGDVILPILDGDAKRDFLLSHTRQGNWDLAHSVAIGDGANDLPMLETAGLGVGFHAKPLVRERVTSQILHGDLTALLYALGYSRNTWVET